MRREDHVMVSPAVDPEARQWSRRPPPAGEREPRIDGCGASLSLARPAPGASMWVDELVGLLRCEVDDAARRGVITPAESQQLLARLVTVIEQGLSTG